jgi:hypothetical protein
MSIIHTRRRFLTPLSLAGAAGLVRASALATERSPETTTVSIAKVGAICWPNRAPTKSLRQARIGVS